MFIIKTRTKITIAILSIIIATGIVAGFLILRERLEKENPSFDEICKFYKDNKDSFSIANNYLLKQLPNERGVIIYDISTVEKDKANMTDEEYTAMRAVFSNPMIEDYCRDVDDDTRYYSFGRFILKSHDQYGDGAISICYIPYGEISSACAHIADNWYEYYDHPVDGPLRN